MVTISPVMVAPVCLVGDPLQITCTAPVEFIKWSVFQLHEQELDNPVQINARDISQQMSQREVNSAIFTFMRISAQFASPLISTLSIDSVNIRLNETTVKCTDVKNPMSSASTTIQITDSNTSKLVYDIVRSMQASTAIITVTDENTPTLSVSEQYEADNVTVIMEWDQQVYDTCCTRVTPLPPLIFTGSTTCQLVYILQYNTEYNLSVVAAAPCRPNVTVAITLHYGEYWYKIVHIHQYLLLTDLYS